MKQPLRECPKMTQKWHIFGSFLDPVLRRFRREKRYFLAQKWVQKWPILGHFWTPISWFWGTLFCSIQQIPLIKHGSPWNSHFGSVQKWPKNVSFWGPKMTQKWVIFGPLFGSLNHVNSASKWPKTCPKMGQKRVQKRPKKGQKWPKNDTFLGHFWTLFLRCLDGKSGKKH